MNAVIVITYRRNMDKEIFHSLARYGIQLKDNRGNARGSKLQYMLFLHVNEHGVINAYQEPLRKLTIDESNELVKWIQWKGTTTVLDNLPAKLTLLGISAGWAYGKTKDFARNIPIGSKER